MTSSEVVRRALVTGITGQDGAYLAALLLDQGYQVTGVLRPSGARLDGAWRLKALGIADRLNYVTVDLSNPADVVRLVRSVGPDEIYHLAALSSVHASFDAPAEAFASAATATTHLLEAIRHCSRHTRFYHASSSEMFGAPPQALQDERTPFHPRSPYAVAKVAAHQMTRLYRIAYGLFCVNGILYNHESPLRGEEFVTRKIVQGLCRWQAGERAAMALGRLDMRRDWGFAGDYARGMYLMMQAASPDDYILATGRTHSVRDFVDLTARAVGIPLRWDGEGVEERAIDLSTGSICVTIDPALFRPADVAALCGDNSLARETLGWSPTVDLPALVGMMVREETKRVQVAMATRLRHMAR